MSGKISTITCHNVYNYGASLQAYALQRFCISLNTQYELINYQPDYLSNHFNLWAIGNPKFNKPLIKQLYLIAKLPGRILSLKRKKKFDKFSSKYLNISPKKYCTYQDLKEDPPKAHIYIAGSDQIWNTFFKNGLDPAFYLSFAANESKKISYAASFATDKIYNNAEKFIKSQLLNFNSISVREKSGLSILQELGFSQASLVMDPVFLLNIDDWTQLIENQTKFHKKFIFLYDCERNDNLKKVALQLRNRLGLPLFSVSQLNQKYANKNFTNVGPLQFLNLLSQSSFVVANSFHALAFSLIFHKEFFIVNRTEDINTRMRDLLEELNLTDRLIDSKINLDTPIDYNQIDRLLEVKINASKRFLQENINQTYE